MKSFVLFSPAWKLFYLGKAIPPWHLCSYISTQQSYEIIWSKWLWSLHNFSNIILMSCHFKSHLLKFHLGIPRFKKVTVLESLCTFGWDLQKFNQKKGICSIWKRIGTAFSRKPRQSKSEEALSSDQTAFGIFDFYFSQNWEQIVLLSDTILKLFRKNLWGS